MNELKTRARWAAWLVTTSLALSSPALGAGAADTSNAPPNVLDGRELVQALRAGGHVVYFRHGATDLSTHDTDRANLANCATQRRLSDEGRQQMRNIGRAMQQLGIRVSSVISSPYCRSIETVQLAFGKVVVDQNLAHTVTADAATADRQAKALRALLARVPPAGTNSALSGHTGNLQEATGIWPSPEGVAIVFKPDGKGRFSFVASVPPTRWAELPGAGPKGSQKQP